MQFLVIEGNIGSGKTTLAKMLAEELNSKLILEQFEANSYLPEFYKNPEQYSFFLELTFLADRYKQIKQELSVAGSENSLIIADYHFSKTDIFAQNTLTPGKYILFRKIYNIINVLVPQPDIYVYLHAESEKLLDNIKKRGREYEKNISIDYLNNINKGYYRFFNQTKSFTILIIDINKIDFLNNTGHFQILKNYILKSDYKLGINRIFLP